MTGIAGFINKKAANAWGSTWPHDCKSRFLEISTVSQDGIHVTIDGRPTWRNDKYSAISNQNSPAAAVLEAYKEYKHQVLEHLYGSFAISIVEPNQNTALLAIDRMGSRPMCYAHLPENGLVFGSTTRVIRRHPQFTTSLSPQAIFSYIYFHCIPSPQTIFNGIYKLEPAQCLFYKAGNIDLHFYWHPTFTEDKTVPFKSQKEALSTHIQNSVNSLINQDNTGAFLSGGLDSSTVVGVFSQLRSPQTIDAYSMGFSEDGYDEIKFARIVAKKFKANLHEYYVTPEDVNSSISTMVSAYDEPFGNSSAIPTYLCAKVAHDQGTRVMLAGDGGDELFAGNARYAQQKIFDLYWKIPSGIRKNGIEPFILNFPFANSTFFTRKAKSYIDQARLPMPDRTESYNYLRRTPLEVIFYPDFIASIDTKQPLESLREIYNRTTGNTLLNQMLFLDWKLTLADNDLRKVTRMCELAGIKVRYPFLDDKLVEFSTHIPSSWKLKHFKLRYFYKQSMKDFLPKETINKTKHGFGLPFGEWLKISPLLQQSVYARLQQLKSRKILLPSFIDQLIKTHREGHAAYYGTMVWILAILEEWLQQNDKHL